MHMRYRPASLPVLVNYLRFVVLCIGILPASPFGNVTPILDEAPFRMIFTRARGGAWDFL